MHHDDQWSRCALTFFVLFTASSISFNPQQEELEEAELVAAVRQLVAERFSNNPAYQLLKARFLSCFTVPALLATIQPVTEETAHHRNNEEEEEEDEEDEEELKKTKEGGKQRRGQVGSAARSFCPSSGSSSILSAESCFAIVAFSFSNQCFYQPSKTKYFHLY